MTVQNATRTRFPGVYQLPNGRYRVRLSLRTKSGRRLQREVTMPVGATEREAVNRRFELEAELLELLQEHPEGKVKDPANTTLSSYVQQWIEARASRLKPSTRSHYVAVLSNFILPELGEVPMSGVTRAKVQEWVRWAERQESPKKKRAYSRDTLNGWYRVLRTVLRDAAADFDLSDPTVRVQPPKSEVRGVREKRTLTTEELGRLLSVTKQGAPEWYPEILVLAYTGIRAGELYAIQWDDFDAKRRSLTIQRAVWRGNVGTTKTDDPRDVGLPLVVVEGLMTHREGLIRSQHRGLASGLIFPSDTGTHRHPNALRKVLRQLSAIAEINIVVGAQVLRRTFNTLLVEAGVDQIVLRSQMGHSSAQMTSRYAGVHIERKQEAAEQLASLVHARGR